VVKPLSQRGKNCFQKAGTRLDAVDWSNMRKATKRTFSKSKTPDELRNWSLTKEQIGHQLKKHYQAYTTEELPPRLLALIKKLNHEEPEQPEGAPKSSA
jgi:hypothetical protein